LPRGDAAFVRLGLLLAVLAWVPVAVLASLGHLLTSGTAIPFLRSLGTHARFLVALPLFFFAEQMFNRRVRWVIQRLVDDGLVRAVDRPRLRDAIARALWWRDTWILEAGLFVLGGVFIAIGLRVDLPGDVNTWRRTPDGHMTAAAWWYGFVSLPLFQFLTWRWMARLLIWWRVLWAIARLDLHLIPTHPDRAGGASPSRGRRC
jgi:hypothetical protein